jgi:di/tricarboxylate transporter
MLVITSFVSHTVAAIVTMPLIASIGAHAGAPAQIVFCCTLTCSAAMALPMSSFPNVNSLLAEDDYGRAYVNAADFVLVGLPASMLVSALSATLAFWLIGLML